MATTVKGKEINFDKLWEVVLGTVKSVINMSQYGHTDIATWQARFSGNL